MVKTVQFINYSLSILLLLLMFYFSVIANVWVYSEDGMSFIKVLYLMLTTSEPLLGEGRIFRLFVLLCWLASLLLPFLFTHMTYTKRIRPLVITVPAVLSSLFIFMIYEAWSHPAERIPNHEWGTLTSLLMAIIALQLFITLAILRPLFKEKRDDSKNKFVYNEDDYYFH